MNWRTSLRQISAVASLATLLVFGWQTFIARSLYNGQWSAFFYTGERVALPPIPGEATYIWKNSAGYDGQFYHLIAHDPFLRHGYARYVDIPRVRYRRILLPLLAWTLTLGHSPSIDTGYFAAQLLAVFLGTFWLAQLFRLQGLSHWWGLGFLAVPAVIVSVDRMTVDLILAALTLGFLLFIRQERWLPLYLVLLLACLTRETGFLLLGAFCAWTAAQKQWSRFFLFTTAAVPAVGWYLYVAGRTAASPVFFTSFPLDGFVSQIRHPTHYAVAGAFWLGLDFAALAAAMLAVFIGLRSVGKRPSAINPITWTPPAWAILGFSVMAIVMSAPQWAEAYAFGRTLTPLFLLVAAAALCSRSWWPAVPLLLVTLRVSAAPVSQTLNAIWHLTRRL